jgi:hypothetical protein
MPRRRAKPKRLPPVALDKKTDSEIPNQPKRVGKSIYATEEWLEWCADNNVLSQMVELAHYEIETCRRYFLHLKLHPSDPGVNPKTLAESFHRAEVFASFSEALGFCQKLSRDSTSASLVTFADLLEALHGSSFFKRNKVSSYMKFVSSSDVFSHAPLDPIPPSSVTSARGSNPDQKQHRASRQTSLPPLPDSVGSPAKGNLVIQRHGNHGSEVTVHPRIKSVQRQDSSEQYQKFILRKSYSRSESTGGGSTETPIPSAGSQAREPLKRVESGGAEGLPRGPASAHRVKVAAIKIYGANKFFKLSTHTEEALAAPPP